MTELLPCPFCGSPAAIEEFDYYDEGPDYGVSCTNVTCACSGPYRFWLTREEAAKAWNTRYERTCRNITDWHPSDEFICSECGFACVISESVDDLEYEYEPRYCPDCGARVLSKISDPVCQDASKISDSEALHDVMVSKVAYSASFGTDRKVMEDDER